MKDEKIYENCFGGKLKASDIPTKECDCKLNTYQFENCPYMFRNLTSCAVFEERQKEEA